MPNQTVARSRTTSHGEIIQLIQKEFAELQVKRAGFSLRAYAQMLGLNATQLAETLNGKRPITQKIAARVFERLCIDPDIGRRLIAQLPAKQVRTKRAGLKGAHTEKKPQPKQCPVLRYVQLSTDEFRVVADWYYFAILSLAETKGFKSDIGWIARRLGIRVRDAKSAVDCLMRLGLIERTESGKDGGRLVVTGKQFTTTNDIPDASIRKNHAQGLEQARDALDRVPVELREITASIMAIDPERLPLAKERLRALKRELVELLEGGEKREVYRLSIQLFPVSRAEDSE